LTESFVRVLNRTARKNRGEDSRRQKNFVLVCRTDQAYRNFLNPSVTAPASEAALLDALLEMKAFLQQ